MDATGRFPIGGGFAAKLFGSVRGRVIAGIVAGVVVVGAVGVGVWNHSAAPQDAAKYRQAKQQLQAQLAAAHREGYTNQDLQPVLSKYKALGASQTAWWIPGQPLYYQAQTSQVTQLQGQLRTTEQRILDQTKTEAATRVAAAKTKVAQAQHVGASDGEIQALNQRLGTAMADQGTARTVGDYRAVLKDVQGISGDATTLYTQTQQENQAIQAASQQVLAQTQGNLQAIQQAGTQAITGGRNDASIAAYLNRLNPFKNFSSINIWNWRLEKYAALVGSADVNQAALGTAGVERYAGNIQNAYSAGLPSKVVIISYSDQHLWALQNGQVAMETAVTSGLRSANGGSYASGDPSYGTDFGAMKVTHKDHPWKMHSPYPPGSPHWYPDTVVQYATFFTDTGESIHDASWEPDSALGPGSQIGDTYRSHGCVHVPANDAVFMYNFADPGTTPIVVYPGDGTSMATQLSLITTNSQGIPDSSL